MLTHVTIHGQRVQLVSKSKAYSCYEGSYQGRILRVWAATFTNEQWKAWWGEEGFAACCPPAFASASQAAESAVDDLEERADIPQKGRTG